MRAPAADLGVSQTDGCDGLQTRHVLARQDRPGAVIGGSPPGVPYTPGTGAAPGGEPPLTRKRKHDGGFDHTETVDAYPRLSNADLDRI
jgi:hypothetical protein